MVGVATPYKSSLSTSGGLLQDLDDGLAGQPGEDQGEDDQEDQDTHRDPTPKTYIHYTVQQNKGLLAVMHSLLNYC